MSNGIGKSFIGGVQAGQGFRANQLSRTRQQQEIERFTDRQNLESMVQGALEFRTIEDPMQQDAFLRNRIAEIESRGGDSRDTRELLSTPTVDRKRVVDNLINIGERFRIIQPGQKQQTQYERGRAFTNKEGKRVVPIYDKKTQRMVRTETIGEPQPGGAIEPLTENEIRLATMLSNNEIDIAQLPKRGSTYNKIVSEAKRLNPNLNVRQLTADFSLSKNPTFRQRAMTAEVLPDILKDIVDSGTKVNFSNLRKIGGFQKFYLSQTNDPDFIEYMSLRNDGLMELASVMRGAGMTDKAHTAEEEAANPTMSPRALKAWYKAQMKALKPRLEIQSRIIEGKTKAGGENINDMKTIVVPNHPRFGDITEADIQKTMLDEGITRQQVLDGIKG